MKLTIFTPTYNRVNYLDKLYKSLLNQTNSNFVWLIVDDGSTDGSDIVINKFINEGKIEIVYYKQSNQGKHIAHNKGVEICETELFFCVDSDDYLTKDAVNIILELWNNKDNDNIYTGIVALKGYSDNKVMANRMPKGVKSSTLSDLYNIYGKKGETALIFKTEYLKSNLFPSFNNEKFLSEEVIYNEIDTIGELIILDKIIYIMEYLESGITKNYINAWRNSPKGVVFLLLSRYRTTKRVRGIRGKILSLKSILVLNAFCIDRKLSVLENSPNRILSFILLPFSYIVLWIKFNYK